MEEEAVFPLILSQASIVIPAYVGHPEGWAQLKACLGALARWREAEWDIVVVDDASPGQGPAIEALAQSLGIRYVRMPKQSGPAAARNYGVSQSSAPLLVFLDADTEVHADTVPLLVGRLEGDPSLAAVIGSYDTAPAAPGLVSRFRNLMHCYVHHQSEGEVTTFWSGCGAIRRERFEALGGFDETYERPSIEDVELGCRLHAAGGKIWLDPRAQVRHWKDFSLPNMVKTDLWQRAVPWTELWRKYPLPKSLNFSWRERLAALAVASLLPLLWLALGNQGNWWLLTLAPLILFGILKLPFLRFLQQHGGAKLAVAGFGLSILHLSTALLGLVIGSGKAEARQDRYLTRIGIGLFALLLAMQVGSHAIEGEYGAHPDEAAHFVSALCVHDYFVQVMKGEAPAIWQLDAVIDWVGQYYLHYPRVALGHWPPIWPLLLGCWMLFFGVSRIAVLALVLSLAWISLMGLYRLVRGVIPVPGAVATVLLLVLTPIFQEALGTAMAEMLMLACSVFMLGAFVEAVSLPQSSPWRLAAALFLGLSSKGTAVCWALLVPFGIVGRQDWFRRSLVLGGTVAVGSVWYLQMGKVAGWGGMTSKISWPILRLGELAGWGIVALAAVAIVQVLWQPRHAATALVRAGAAMVLCLVIGSFALRSMQETRHWVLVLPALILLAVTAVLRLRWPLVGVVAGLLALLFFPWSWYRQESQHAAEILSQIGPKRRLLLALDTIGEGSVIASASSSKERPYYFLARGSKVFASSSWSGGYYRLLSSTPGEVLRRLDELAIEVIVVHPQPLEGERPHIEIARRSVQGSSVWIPCGATGRLQAFCRAASPQVPRVALELEIRGRILREHL
jgi:hypothetical protein